ncbi:hypothetical protein DPV73_11740 [Leptospira mayottensis]|nr:hypothetical protein DPV73_11740 [Leptospira mayottensis]
MWEFSHFKDRFIQTKTISVFFFSIADRKKTSADENLYRAWGLQFECGRQEQSVRSNLDYYIFRLFAKLTVNFWYRFHTSE